MNHLCREKSPYLLQHADNPVDWYPWGKEALDKAQQEHKPIFISIGYSTCHWCHVMAHESFEDEEVARKLNQNYIAIKVDREERPDIDAGFMHACQLLNGHGGWPLNLFLSSEAKPFYALTYAPKHTTGRYPGFIEILEKINELWLQQSDSLIANGEQLSEAIMGIEQHHENIELQENLLQSAAKKFKQLYDPRHGGFGQAPKFPQPHNQSLLLRLAQRFDDPSLQQMALQTLFNIDQGGITDQLGGGMHRYSVDDFWLVPHFEKMLYDQALIAIAYLDAWQVTNNQFFKNAANNILNYTIRELNHSEGGFYCGEDADSEGAEGTYYLWSPDELKNILAKKEISLFSDTYNVSVEGNFEGKNILHRNASVIQFTERYEELPTQLKNINNRLLKARNHRPHPHLDDKILTGWNGLMIAALARAGFLLQNADYLCAAEKTVNFIQNQITIDGHLKRRYRDNETLINAFHEDYSFYIFGLIELFLANFKPEHLDLALTLVERCENLFADNQGGYYDSAVPFVNGMGRGKTKQDGAIPAAASVTAHNLIRLARLTGKSHLEDRAKELLCCTLAKADEFPTAFSWLLQALDLTLTEQMTLAVILPAADEYLTEDWLNVLLPLRPQLLTVITATPEKYVNTIPFVVDKTVIDGKITAWLCTGTSCQAPVTEAAVLSKLLQTHVPLNTFSK